MRSSSCRFSRPVILTVQAPGYPEQRITPGAEMWWLSAPIGLKVWRRFAAQYVDFHVIFLYLIESHDNKTPLLLYG